MLQIDHSPRKDAKSQPLLSLMLLHTLELCLSRWVNQLIRSSKVRSYWQKNKENWQKLGSFKSWWVRKPYLIKRSQLEVDPSKRSFGKELTSELCEFNLAKDLEYILGGKLGAPPTNFLYILFPFLPSTFKWELRVRQFTTSIQLAFRNKVACSSGADWLIWSSMMVFIQIMPPGPPGQYFVNSN